MSHWSTDLIIDNIRDTIDTIKLLEQEVESLASADEYALAYEVYAELLQARKRLAELEQSVSL
jgi:FtsZ-binding cell division protein ZapB